MFLNKLLSRGIEAGGGEGLLPHLFRKQHLPVVLLERALHFASRFDAPGMYRIYGQMSSVPSK